MVRYVKATEMPSTATGKVAALRMPLVFDPGDKWEYGINIDWVGRLVEAVSGQTLDVYFRDKIFAPLGMKDSGYVTSTSSAPARPACTSARLTAPSPPQPLETAVHPRILVGWRPALFYGSGLPGVPADAAAWGSFNGAQLLRPETVALMGQNHIGNIPAGIMKTENPGGRTMSISFLGLSQMGGWATCSTCSPGRTAGARHGELGGLQHLLLARPGAARHRADHAADPALCRPARVAALRAVRERYLQCCEGGVMPSR